MRFPKMWITMGQLIYDLVVTIKGTMSPGERLMVMQRFRLLARSADRPDLEAVAPYLARVLDVPVMDPMSSRADDDDIPGGAVAFQRHPHGGLTTEPAVLSSALQLPSKRPFTIVGRGEDTMFRVVGSRGVCPRGMKPGDLVTLSQSGSISPSLCPLAEATLRSVAASGTDPSEPTEWCCPIYDHLLVFSQINATRHPQSNAPARVGPEAAAEPVRMDVVR